MPTITIAALGAIESLLCARVADQLATSASHRKHDPNQELLAQGAANFVVPFLGGMPVTGTIARTVTNLRSGATSPISGLVHSLVLMLIVLRAPSGRACTPGGTGRGFAVCGLEYGRVARVCPPAPIQQPLPPFAAGHLLFNGGV